MSGRETLTSIAVALISAGLLNFIKDALKARGARRDARRPEAIDSLRVTAADESLIVVAKARDELAEDNRRLREQLTEERARYAEDEARWGAKERAYRAEIDALEQKVRAILAELEALKSRHAENR